MAKTKPVTDIYREPSEVTFFFSEKDKNKLKVPSGIAIDQEATILVRGKIRSFSSSSNQWDNGTRFSMDMTSCEVLAPTEPPKTLNDALKSAEKKV